MLNCPICILYELFAWSYLTHFSCRDLNWGRNATFYIVRYPKGKVHLSLSLDRSACAFQICSRKVKRIYYIVFQMGYYRPVFPRCASWTDRPTDRHHITPPLSSPTFPRKRGARLNRSAYKSSSGCQSERQNRPAHSAHTQLCERTIIAHCAWLRRFAEHVCVVRTALRALF